MLALLVQRWTAPEIAERLSLSERTIESHVASIYNKLGVSSRRDAVTVAIGHGLIPGWPNHSDWRWPRR